MKMPTASGRQEHPLYERLVPLLDGLKETVLLFVVKRREIKPQSHTAEQSVTECREEKPCNRSERRAHGRGVVQASVTAIDKLVFDMVPNRPVGCWVTISRPHQAPNAESIRACVRNSDLGLAVRAWKLGLSDFDGKR